MIKISQKGDFSKTIRFLNKVKRPIPEALLKKYGEIGVAALSYATPYDTGKTAASWRYEIHSDQHRANISFYNDNINAGVPIAIILQYGHGTRNGGYVQGMDYINPAVKPVFEYAVENIWKEVDQ